ncbi:hypothetical protein LCGC14_0999760 [marine sediment metagenome]|uniref:Adenine phosphoribosyltransferase n=1 Tax=marine sediment metagenome TaxID=412755 RepID=A0A0F9QLU2_9ZZZZ|nr:MAG: hypothetical protein Lokiarch_05900 [Candidatus Lokiarchaeum sp. GC14_75]HEC40230.1 adenine phosphoribosyltransferase [bacterium]
MSEISNINNKFFLPVVHALNIDQTMRQLKIAFSCKADGVFLIGHGIRYNELFGIYSQIRDVYPFKWIGLNCLDLRPLELFSRIPKGVNGVWVDNAYINEELDVNKQEYPLQVKNLINKIKWEGLYFGGVAFKYQKRVNNPILATKIACQYMDVVTTSGLGTGISAEPEKIKSMSPIVKKYNKKLGIASGITINNVEDYKSVNYFLVATGISTDFYTFNPELVKELSDKIKKLKKIN